MATDVARKCDDGKFDDGFFNRLIHGRFSIRRKPKGRPETDDREPNENIGFISKKFANKLQTSSYANESFEYDKMNPSPRSSSALESTRSLSSDFNEGRLRPLCTSTPKMTGEGDDERPSFYAIRNFWRKVVHPTGGKTRKSTTPNQQQQQLETSPLLH